MREWRETSSSGGKQASGDIKLAGGSSQTETSGVRRCACFVAHVCVTPGARVCSWRAHVRTSQHSNMRSERLQNVLPLSDAFCGVSWRAFLLNKVMSRLPFSRRRFLPHEEHLLLAI